MSAATRWRFWQSHVMTCEQQQQQYILYEIDHCKAFGPCSTRHSSSAFLYMLMICQSKTCLRPVAVAVAVPAASSRALICFVWRTYTVPEPCQHPQAGGSGKVMCWHLNSSSNGTFVHVLISYTFLYIIVQIVYISVHICSFSQQFCTYLYMPRRKVP